MSVLPNRLAPYHYLTPRVISENESIPTPTPLFLRSEIPQSLSALAIRFDSGTTLQDCGFCAYGKLINLVNLGVGVEGLEINLIQSFQVQKPNYRMKMLDSLF